MLVKRRKEFAVPEVKDNKQQIASNKTTGMIKEVKPVEMPDYMKHELPDADSEGRDFMSSANSELNKL